MITIEVVVLDVRNTEEPGTYAVDMIVNGVVRILYFFVVEYQRDV